MAELLIVVAITIILAAVGFIAIFQYQQNLKFTEMENDAREVFLAAQNSLTSMKENGVTLKANDKTMGKTMPSDFDDAFTNSGIKGTSASQYWDDHNSHFKYVSHKAGESINKDSVLGQILDFGSVDDTVRISGSYIIEYDEETYTVYGVFYSDYHGASKVVQDGKADLTDHYDYLRTNRTDKQKRKEFGKTFNLGRLTTVGYYGAAADDGDGNLAKNVKAPEITIYNSKMITYENSPSVKPENIENSSRFSDSIKTKIKTDHEDTLALIVKNPNKAKVNKNLSRISVEVSGGTSHEKKTITYFMSKGSSFSNSRNGWVALGSNTYLLNLDDIERSDGHFTQIFKNFIPGENVTVTVSFMTKSGKTSVEKTLSTNSLFDSLDEDKNTASIRSPRQLQNLEPDISNINKTIKDKDNKNKNISLDISNVTVTEDINWTGYNTKSVYQWNKAVVGKEGEKNFLSVHNAKIKSFDGQNHIISNLNAVDNEVKIDNNTTHNDAGLFAYTDDNDDLKINDLTLKDINVTVSDSKYGNAGGFVGEAKGNVTINDSHIEASKDIAIQAKGTNDENSVGNAGGMIGYADHSKMMIKNSYVQPSASDDQTVADSTRNSIGIEVNATSNAGGIIGAIYYQTAEINNTYFDGGIKGIVKANDRSAGGFIGRSERSGLTISNSYTTTYVYTEGAKLGRAGGFIGFLNQEDHKSVITDSFYGGRTKDGKYGTEVSDDNSKIDQEKYNIINNGKSSGGDEATAGGFIGTAQEGDAKDVSISNCYTTGSVYVKEGIAGGFIGKTSNDKSDENSPVLLTNTYATGLVDSKSNNSKLGAFIGEYPINNGSSNNYYLDGINPKLNASGDNSTNGSVSGASAQDEGPFKVDEANQVNAIVYDSSLGEKYPYRFINSLDPQSKLSEHVGDWPIAPEPNDTGIKVDNGNKLTFHIALPEGTDKFTVAVTGETTGKTYYVPMQIVDPDSDNGVRHIHWDSFTDVANNSDGEWIKNSQPGRSLPECTMARIESKETYDAVNVSKSISSALPSSVSSAAESSENSIFIAMDLDDISSELQNQRGPFSELFRDAANGLIPGENITVRVLPRWKYNFDLNTVKGASANSIFANGSNGTDSGKNQQTALIANIRHLENLSEVVSDLQRNESVIKFTKAKQTDNIIWTTKRPASSHANTPAYVEDIKEKNGITTTISIHGFNQSTKEYTTEDHFYPVFNDKITDYDGGNYSIENVDLDTSKTNSIKGNEPAAIFFCISSNGKIHDLKINNVNAVAEASNDVNAAGLISSGNGITLKNISVTGNSSIEAKKYGIAGGIAGELSGTSTLENCKVEGDVQISSIQRDAGGIAGKSSDTSTLKNCTIKGDVQITSAQHDAGGIAGELSGTPTLQNCTVEGNVLISSVQHNAGGIAGESGGNATIENCLVDGNDMSVSGGTDQNAASGGLLGSFNGQKLRINNSSASVYVNMNGTGNSGYAGGLVGYINASDNSTINDSYAGGHTAGGKYVGSIITDKSNQNYSLGHYNVINFSNNNGSAGGFIGAVKGNLNITSCYSTASSYGFSSGGLIGNVLDKKVKVDNTYAIGMVDGPGNNAAKGAFIGAGSPDSASGSYYLALTNPGLKGGSTCDFNGVSATRGDEIKVQRKTGTDNASPYDVLSDTNPNGLSNSYPFKLISELDKDAKSKKNADHHYGDWYDISKIDVLNDPVEVQFFDGEGILSDTLYVNRGSSVVNQIPELPVPDGMEFTGWYTQDNQAISPEQLNSVTAPLNAYAHYQPDNNHVQLFYVNPYTKQPVSLGVEKIENGSVKEPVVPTYGDYKRKANWNSSPTGDGTDYYTNNGSISDWSGDSKSLYLTYDEKKTYTISLEIRADDKENNYPQIYRSYIYEYSEDQLNEDKKNNHPFTAKVDLSQFESENPNYQLDENPLKKRDPNQGTLKDTYELQLDKNKKVVEITVYPYAINGNITYVVLYKGAPQTYTINHVFKDSEANSDVQSPVVYNAQTDPDPVAFVNGKMHYAPGKEFTVTETGSGSLGEYIDLQQHVFSKDDSDTGYEASLSKNKNYVLDEDNNIFTIEYTRKTYRLTIDTDSDVVASNSPAEVPYGADISSDSSYLKDYSILNRTGYDHGSPVWLYSSENSGNENDLGEISTMPAENVTAKLNWIESKSPAKYKVEVWTQTSDASQTPKTSAEQKKYDYYASFEVEIDDEYNPGTGYTPTFFDNAEETQNVISKHLSSDQVNGLKYFYVDTDNASRTNGSTTIQADGTTVYRVFYDRKIITVNFDYGPQQLYIGRSGGWFVFTTNQSESIDIVNHSNTKEQNNPSYPYKYTNDSYPSTYRSIAWIRPSQDRWDDTNQTMMRYPIGVDANTSPNPVTGLFGQDFKDEKLFQDYAWEYNRVNNPKPTSLGSLMSFNLPADAVTTENGNQITMDLHCKGTNSDDIKVDNYLENPDGGWTFKNETTAATSQTFSLSDDRFNGFTAYGSSWGDLGRKDVAQAYDSSINKDKTFEVSATSKVLNLFYNRKSYDITLENINSNKDNHISVKYGQQLKDSKLPLDNQSMSGYIPLNADRNNQINGYTFDGWYESETFDPNSRWDGAHEMPNHNVVLYAKWKAPSYSVTYYDGNTKINSEPETVEKYQHISATDPSVLGYQKSGYTFEGWYTDPSLKDADRFLSSRPVTENLNLYAKYELNEGTEIHYTVKYQYDDGTEAYKDKQVTANVGSTYVERPVPIQNAVPLDAYVSGRVTGAMDGITITFKYHKYANSGLNYTVQNMVEYQDIDSGKKLEAKLNSVESSTTSTEKIVRAANQNGYLVEGSSEKVISSKDTEVDFKYKVDFDSLKAVNTHVIYGSSSTPSFEGLDNLAVPDGYHLEVVPEYMDSNGNSHDDRPTDAGTYKVKLNLRLTNGKESILVYSRTCNYLVIPKTIVLTSATKAFNYNGEYQRNDTVTSDQAWNDGEGASYEFTGPGIKNPGTIQNEFEVYLNDNTKSKNYNIYRIFGTLTVNG